MLVNIEIIEKPELATKASFELKNLQSEKDYKEALAIIFMISADYYLDPELEIEDLKEYVHQGRDKDKSLITIFFDEEGLELEFI